MFIFIIVTSHAYSFYFILFFIVLISECKLGSM